MEANNLNRKSLLGEADPETELVLCRDLLWKLHETLRTSIDCQKHAKNFMATEDIRQLARQCALGTLNRNKECLLLVEEAKADDI